MIFMIFNALISLYDIVSNAKNGKQLSCKNCGWCIPLADCEHPEDMPGSFDVCSVPFDIEKMKLIDGSTENVVRNARCVVHRSYGIIGARIGNWCGKEARWYVDKSR